MKKRDQRMRTRMSPSRLFPELAALTQHGWCGPPEDVKQQILKAICTTLERSSNADPPESAGMASLPERAISSAHLLFLRRRGDRSVARRSVRSSFVP